MILTVEQSLIIILIISVITFLIRGLPFIVFPANKKTPTYIVYLGTVLPYAIIGMLIVYCLKEASLSVFPFGSPECIAIFFIVMIHIYKKNTLLSIGGGTFLYMLLVQLVFV